MAAEMMAKRLVTNEKIEMQKEQEAERIDMELNLNQGRLTPESILAKHKSVQPPGNRDIPTPAAKAKVPSPLAHKLK